MLYEFSVIVWFFVFVNPLRFLWRPLRLFYFGFRATSNIAGSGGAFYPTALPQAIAVSPLGCFFSYQRCYSIRAGHRPVTENFEIHRSPEGAQASFNR